MSNEWWEYNNLKSGAPYNWEPAHKGDHPDDNIDFHVDLGAGRLPKGRLCIDRHGDADVLMNLDTGVLDSTREPIEFAKDKPFYSGLPFPDNSIKSMVSHHCLEHIGFGFLNLMNECYRVLMPGAKFRIVVPLFPSITAVEDPDHNRYFCKGTFDALCGPDGGPFWSDTFAEPYTTARFKLTHKDYSPSPVVEQGKTMDDLFGIGREIRVTLQSTKIS